MQSSKKLNIFHQHFTAYVKSIFHLKHFEKNDESHSFCLSEVIEWEICAYVTVYRVMFQYTQGQSTC